MKIAPLTVVLFPLIGLILSLSLQIFPYPIAAAKITGDQSAIMVQSEVYLKPGIPMSVCPNLIENEALIRL